MPNRTVIDQTASAREFAEHEAAKRRIDLLHHLRSVLLGAAMVLAAVAAWAALQAPPAPSAPAPAPQPAITTAAPCPPRPPATTTPAGGYVPGPASAYDPEDC